MTEKRSRKLSRTQFAVAIAGSLALVCAAVLGLLAMLSVQTEELRVARTRVKMSAVAGACAAFYRDFGRWPESVGELRSNNKGLIYLDGNISDGWGTPIIYLRPVGTDAPALVSYGADAAVDGDTNDGDFRMTLVATNGMNGGSREKD